MWTDCGAKNWYAGWFVGQKPVPVDLYCWGHQRVQPTADYTDYIYPHGVFFEKNKTNRRNFDLISNGVGPTQAIESTLALCITENEY